MAAVRNVVVRIAADVSQLQKGLKKASSSLKATGDKMKNIGEGLTKTVSTPLAALGVLSVKTAADFEKSMSNVQANSGKSGAALNELRQAALNMGKKTSKSAADAADALNYMALAGWDNEQMLTSLEPILRLSEAGNLDLARTSDLVTDSMQAFKLEAKDVSGYLDVVAQTSRNANTPIDGMLEGIINVGGAMAGLGVDAKELALGFSVLADNGIKGTEAGNSFSSIMANMKNPIGQAKKAMDELGFSIYDGKGEFIGLEKSMEILRAKTKDLTTQERERLLGMIGGKEQMKTLAALLDITKDKYDKTAEAINKSDGALMEMALTMQKNFYGALNKLQSSLSIVAIQMGNVLLPYLTKGAAIVNRFSDIFGNLPKSVKVATVVLGLFGIVIPPLIVAGGFLITALGAIAGALAGLTVPVAAVVAILGTVGTAFISLTAGSTSFRQSLKTGFKILLEKAKELQSILAPIVEVLKNKIKELASSLKKYWQENGTKIIDGLKSAFERIKSAAIPAIELIKDTVKRFVESIKPAFEDIKRTFDDLVKLFKENETQIKAVFAVLGVAVAWMASVFLGAFTGLVRSLGSAVSVITGLIDIVINAFRLVTAVIRGDWGKVLDIVVDIAKGIWDVIVSTFSAIVEFVVGFVASVIGVFKTLYYTLVGGSIIPDMVNEIVAWFTKLPSKVLGVLSSFVSRVISKFGSLAVGALNKIRNFSSQAVSTVSRLGSNILTALGGVATKAYNAGAKVVNQLVNGIKSKITAAKTAISNVATSIMKFLPQSPAKEGPLKGLGTAGEQIVYQISSAMEKEIPTMKLATQNLTTSIMDVFKKDISNVAKMFDKLRDNIKDTYKEMENDAQKDLNDLAGTIQDALKTQAKEQQEANENKIKKNIDTSKEELKNKENELTEYDKSMKEAYSNRLAQETLFAMNVKRKKITDRIEQLKSEVEFGNNMLEQVKKGYDSQISEQELYNRTSYLLQAENQDSLISLLETYAPDWEDKGKSFAEKFMDGFRGIHTDMATELNRVMNQVNNVLGVNVGGVVNETYKLEKTWSETIQSMKNNSVSWDREYNLMKARIQSIKDKLTRDKNATTGKNATSRKSQLEKIAEQDIRNVESRFRNTVQNLEQLNVGMGTQLGLTKRDGSWYLPTGEKAYDTKSDTSIEVPVYLDGQKIARGIMPHVVRDARFKGGVN